MFNPRPKPLDQIPIFVMVPVEFSWGNCVFLTRDDCGFTLAFDFRNDFLRVISLVSDHFRDWMSVNQRYRLSNVSDLSSSQDQF